MIYKIFPFLSWFQGYNSNKFKIDFIAGMTVALVLIPQSMAYAQLAGLPAYYGLYAAFMPPMIAALFGSSRQLATGPVAVVSLMTAASLEPLATAGSSAFIIYAVMLALTVGIFQLMLGVLRLGLIVNFLSHPVVNGFTNAAAIIIASSQFSKLFGVYVDKASHHYQTIIDVVKAAFAYTHLPTFLMGISAIIMMYVLKRINPKIPYVLVAVVVTTFVSWLTGFDYNKSLPVSDIASMEVQKDINQFNRTIKEISRISEARTKIIAELKSEESSHKGHGISEKILHLNHEISIAGYKIGELKEHSHNLRTKLRSIKFTAVKSDNKTIVFYPEKDLQENSLKSDHRVWRIKIGNKLLNEKAIVMIGGGAVVGSIPKGLPDFSIPQLKFSVFMQLLPFAIIISLLGFMEAIAIAKAMASKTGQRIDPNQELIGQGLANIIGSFTKSYPVSGSFSRSAVNLQSGAVSGVSSVVTSAVVIIALLFFTPLLYHLPQAVLAAIIMMAVIGLVNVKGFIHAWQVQWYDGVISVITFCATLIAAPHLEEGIYIGVALSLGVYLYKSMRPRLSSLSRSVDHELRASAVHGLLTCKYIDLIRFEGPLFFANASFLVDAINSRLLETRELKHIIIASNGINDIDASGEEALSLVIDQVRSAGRDISFSGINESVMAVLKRTHLIERIGKDHIFPTMEKAVMTIHPMLHGTGAENECPLVTFCGHTHSSSERHQ